MADNNNDIDRFETSEWLAALQNVIEQDGSERAKYLLEQLTQEARAKGLGVAASGSRDYINTIRPEEQPHYPGDAAIEKRISAYARWNAVAMVVRAGHVDSSLGGHLASYASSSTLYQVGFNHHYNAESPENGGDLVYFQGHSAPGIYSRAFLEGHLTEEQLDHYRQEVAGKGISSYPHPRTMPDFWQFPTVSMGLGPLQAIYNAQFLKYLDNQGLADTKNRKVWAYLGDGETDEPESLGCIAQAAYMGLDNLIFVVNCNLQRLDGPVRGNGSIVRELEGLFGGADWNVIKLMWGSRWDALFEKDKSGLLIKRMNECVDGDYQAFKHNDGAFIREHFFGKYPELLDLVADLSDDDIWRLHRGGHDPVKIHAAYEQAKNSSNGKPTVILAQTVKGFRLGSIMGDNNAHNIKKMSTEQLMQLRDELHIPLTDKQVEDIAYVKFDEKSEEMQYMRDCRQKLGGKYPHRRQKVEKTLPVPSLDKFQKVLDGTGDREVSSNMNLVRVLDTLYKDKALKDNVVTIIPDESRTLGLEGLFRQVGIYSAVGQLYTPVDAGQLITYKEDVKGKILQQGINEAGSFASWMAASTSYSSNNVQMIPFYFFYSMFGMQRIADLAWAAGDIHARGFLIGGLSGRTALPGEGLQHADGHSHVISSVIPCCVSYDPTYGYEIAVIIQRGMTRMIENQEDVYYYITMMNENYAHPAMPKGVEEGIIKGLYCMKPADSKAKKKRVQLLGSGSILREVEKAADMLKADFGVEADVWSATSMNELRKDGLHCERWNLLHPTEKAKVSYVAECLAKQPGPVISTTDYMRVYSDQIRQFLPGKTFVSLGTDGFGMSDTRAALREHFEVDSRYIVVAALSALAQDGEVSAKDVAKAIKKYNINADAENPLDL
tara:strand:- start:3245 stop:5914 length:2670 start_codon:yes stop_codon:yes gene_type:complete